MAAQGVTACRFENACPKLDRLNGAMQNRFVDVRLSALFFARRERF